MIGPDLDPNCLTLKELKKKDFEKNQQTTIKKHEKNPSRRRVNSDPDSPRQLFEKVVRTLKRTQLMNIVSAGKNPISDIFTIVCILFTRIARSPVV